MERASCRVSDPKKISSGVLCLQSSTITAGADRRFLACRLGSGRSLRWDGQTFRAEHRSGNVDHLRGPSPEAQGCVPGSTRVVDLPVYLSASVTSLCRFVALTRYDSLVDGPCRSADVLCFVSSASPHCCSAYGRVGSPAGPRSTERWLCDAASERDGGTPISVGSGAAAQPRSQSMDRPAEGATPAGERARPKTATRQIASTPKRATAQAERRLRAQSFTAAATPDNDPAQEAVRQALPLQPRQAVPSQQTAAGGNSGGSGEQPPGALASGAAVAAAAPDPAPAARDQESPITSRQRRAPGTAPARAAGGAAKAPGGRVPAHHDGRGHMPPADHHAEAQTGALPPPETAVPAREKPAAARPAATDGDAPAGRAAETTSGETREPSAAPRGGGRKGRSAAEGSDGSDERRDAPAATGAAAAPQPQAQPPPKAAAGAKVAGSLFSPVFSLFGGKPASDVPPQPGDDEQAGLRSPGEAGDRQTADVSAARPPSGGAKGDSSADGEPAVAVRPAEDDVHSENDTQIRVPSGHSSGSQARGCA